MCGRFTLRSDANALAQHFGLDEKVLAAGFPPPVLRDDLAGIARAMVLRGEDR